MKINYVVSMTEYHPTTLTACSKYVCKDENAVAKLIATKKSEVGKTYTFVIDIIETFEQN